MENLNLVSQDVSSDAKQHNLNARNALPQKTDSSHQDIVEITVNAFKDISHYGENSPYIKNSSWLNELPIDIFNYAKYILRQDDPKLAMQFERMLPGLQKHCPEINILRQTIPYSQMKYPPPLSIKILNPEISGKNTFRASNPISGTQIPLGLIYSRTANGARRETPPLSDNSLIKSPASVSKKSTDFGMFNYGNLYSNIPDI